MGRLGAQRRLTCSAILAVTALIAPVAPAHATELPTITARYAVGVNPAGLAITPDGVRIVTANSGSNNASIINRASGVVTAVPTQANPIGLVITPDGGKAYVSNHNFTRPSATVIDLPGAAVLQTIELLSRPSKGAVSGDGSLVFIPSQDNRFGVTPVNEIARIQTSTGTVLDRLQVNRPGCVTAAPDGVMFLTCRAIQSSVGLFTTTTAAGDVRTVSLPGGAAVSAAFSPDSATAYVSNQVSNAVDVINVASGTVTSTTVVGSFPSAIVVSPNGQRIFVANTASSSISVLTRSGALIATTSISGSPSYVGVSNDGRFVLVATSAGDLVVLDSTGTQVLTTLTLGGSPSDLAVARSGDFAAISLSNTDEVVVVRLPPSEIAGENIPRAPIQQYVPAPGEECGVNPPPSVDFQALVGMRNLGWGRSWAEWPNNGRGGTVCSRQPYFTNAGTWAIR